LQNKLIHVKHAIINLKNKRSYIIPFIISTQR